jgi:3-oxoacyl-[acyl-carrier protein] reductase
MGEGTILVTGGSRGIGQAIVSTLAADGRRVAFTWRSDEAAARSIEKETGGAAKAFHMDLMDRARPSTLVSEVEQVCGPIAGLVNNAGVRRDALLAMTTDADWDAVLETNLGGVFRCCRAVIPGMVSRRSGSIVNIASLAALHGLPGQACYAATKAGILGLTRALAREVGKRQVRVNAVVPGLVETDLVASMPPEMTAALRATECLPGGTSASSVAGTVSFLLSERAGAITGQMIVVDSGSSA